MQKSNYPIRESIVFPLVKPLEDYLKKTVSIRSKLQLFSEYKQVKIAYIITVFYLKAFSKSNENKPLLIPALPVYLKFRLEEV